MLTITAVIKTKTKIIVYANDLIIAVGSVVKDLLVSLKHFAQCSKSTIYDNISKRTETLFRDSLSTERHDNLIFNRGNSSNARVNSDGQSVSKVDGRVLHQAFDLRGSSQSPDKLPSSAQSSEGERSAITTRISSHTETCEADERRSTLSDNVDSQLDTAVTKLIERAKQVVLSQHDLVLSQHDLVLSQHDLVLSQHAGIQKLAGHINDIAEACELVFCPGIRERSDHELSEFAINVESSEIKD